MLINFLFIASFFCFVSGILFVKTNQDKIGFLKKIIISIITVISIGGIWAFIINCVNIPVGLASMSAGYFVCAVLVWLYILKDRKNRTENMSLNVAELFSFFVCFGVWAYVFVKTFGLDISISYNNVDAGTHFGFANEILQTHKLNRMYFAALYNSLVMELFEPFLTKITIYKAFIISDALFNLLNTLMFYVLASEFIKSKFSKVAINFVIVFYFFGWPVWSWIAGGFVYFGVGVTLYMYGVYLLHQIDKYQDKKIYHAIMILITIFSITQCYLLFAPIYMLTILVYILYKNKNILTKKNVILGLSIVLSISIIVFLIIFIGYFKGNISSVFRAFKLDGGVHRELYKDFMFIFPICIFMFVKKFKNKKIDVLMFSIVCHAIIVTGALVANITGIMSDYYYFKLYYVGWALQLVGVVDAIDYFWSKSKDVIYYFFAPLIITFVLEVTGLGQSIIWSDSGNFGVFPIISQSINYVKTLHDNNLERKRAMVSLWGWNENNLDIEIPLVSDISDSAASWYNAVTGDRVYYKFGRKEINENSLNDMLYSFKENGYKYFAVLQDVECYVEYEKWFEQFKCEYSDGYYAVYKLD